MGKVIWVGRGLVPRQILRGDEPPAYQKSDKIGGFGEEMGFIHTKQRRAIV